MIRKKPTHFSRENPQFAQRGQRDAQNERARKYDENQSGDIYSTSRCLHQMKEILFKEKGQKEDTLPYIITSNILHCISKVFTQASLTAMLIRASGTIMMNSSVGTANTHADTTDKSAWAAQRMFPISF